MKVSAHWRQPVSLLTAVSFIIGFFWFALGYPVPIPRSPLGAGEKVPCVSYAPVALPQNGGEDEAPVSPERIEADLARLAKHSACVRTYLTGLGLDRIPEIAERHGIVVLQGIALGRDAERNRKEIDRAIALARSNNASIRAFVAGSEVLSRKDMSESGLAALIRQLRQETKLPVTYADGPEVWSGAGLMAEVADFITIKTEFYQAKYPVAASEAVRRMLEAHTKIVAKYRDEKAIFIEAGWPSAGRMRGGALPSPANQALVLHELIAAAKARNVQPIIFEGIDQPWRKRIMGTAAGHWGLLEADDGALKFRWGGEISNHPYWFIQALTGIMLVFVVFAAAFLAARSSGVINPEEVDWRPVAVIALAGGVPIGWAIAEMPLQNRSVTDWMFSGLVLALAFAVPPVAAAASVRRTPFPSFGGMIDPAQRSAMKSLEKAVAALFVLVVIVAVQAALTLTFDPAIRDIPFAAMTGSIVALLVLAFHNPRGESKPSLAEPLTAALLAATSLFIVINETFWNWQALWFAALLLALAWTCWRAAGARIP